jgi:hypothetical protein
MEALMKDRENGTMSKSTGCFGSVVGVGLGLALGALAGIVAGLAGGVGIALILGVL